MVASEKKTRANRRNAKSSTGPMNTAATRFNAVKHGIFCHESVVKIGFAAENKASFEELYSTLKEQLAPVGALEELLVDQLISCS